VVSAAARLKERGFREMKTQLSLPGETTPAKEVERMVRVREAIGPNQADVRHQPALAGRPGDRHRPAS